MAPTTFSLVQINAGSSSTFFDTIKKLPPAKRPLWVGECHHWIHQPKLSSDALNGTGPELQKWDYLVVSKAASPNSTSPPGALESHIEKFWSLTAEVSDDMLASLPVANEKRSTEPHPSLPQGWSAADSSGLKAAIPPPDLEASLGLESYLLGSNTSSTQPIKLQDFIGSWTPTHPGPVAMFNLLSYFPSQRERYFQYVAAFTESVGSKYGGEPIFLGLGVTDWTSRGEKGDGEGWEDTALIWYPSLWHFGKMLDDESYAEVDRKFKQGSLRDNPLICCSEIVVEYQD